jgi:lipoyl-dependent peroxiredoxin
MVKPLERVLYTATAASIGGRAGHVRTDDGTLALQIAPPRKKTPGATNPEQLFAAGYAACFASALAEVATEHAVDASKAEVSCQVQLGTTSTAAGYGLAVELHVSDPRHRSH